MSAVATVRRTTNRRNYRLLWIVLSAGAISALVVGLVFVWPKSNGRQTRFDLGSIDHFGIASVTQVPAGRFYLVRLSASELIALSWRGPGRGCTVPWRANFVFPDQGGTLTAGWFRDPCTGSTFDRSGHKVFGPSPRDMDRYPVTFEGDHVIVDTTQYLCGWAPAGPCAGPTPTSPPP